MTKMQNNNNIVTRTRLCDFKVLYRVHSEGFKSQLRLAFNKLEPTALEAILRFDRFVVLKETPQTYLLQELWLPQIEDGDFYNPDEYVNYIEKKRIYKTATNRFAWETKELAMADYVRKQQFRRGRLMQELDECNANIEKGLRYNLGDDEKNVY